MTQCKVYPGYTNFYTYTPGAKVIQMKRTRHALGGEVVIHRQALEFGSAAEAQRYFDTECGA